MISFSKRVKKELCAHGKLKNCCGYSLIYGLMLCAETIDNKKVIKMLNSDVGEYFVLLCQQLNIKSSYEYDFKKNRIYINSDFFRYKDYGSIRKNIIKCPKCKECFLKGIFLAVGSVTDPEKSYRLELVFDNENNADNVAAYLQEFFIDALRTKRNDKTVLYLRKSEAIEDFFANMGATSLAFDIMNSKINKEKFKVTSHIVPCVSV